MVQTPGFEKLRSDVRDFEQHRENSAPLRPPRKTSAQNVPGGRRSLQAIPVTAILADILKTFEMQLIQKGILTSPPPGVSNPIWFLAEVEQNIFLWRSGYSIGDRDNFEFWIDIPALIKKRLNQLNNRDYENPFTNPLWGIDGTSDDNEEHCELRKNMGGKEDKYLRDFLGAFTKIEAHAHALSYAGIEVLKELGEKPRQHIVLPDPQRRKT